MTTFTAKETKTIAAAINNLAKRWQGIDTTTQTVALDVLLHAHVNREVSLVNKLYLALGKGARHEAMAQWLMLYAPVKANAVAATKEERPFLFEKDKALDGDELVTLMGNASRNPWYMSAPSKAPDEVFDFAKALKALLAKADREVKAGRSVSDPDAVAKLREMLPTVKGAPKKEEETNA